MQNQNPYFQDGVEEVKHSRLIQSLTETFMDELDQSKLGIHKPWHESSNLRLAETLEHAKRIAEMIHHFRGLAAGDRGVNTVETLVHDSVYQVLRAMQYEFPLENITILKILPTDLSPFPLPREHFETILFGLLDRARTVLAGYPNGIITIEAAERMCLTRENKSAHRFVLRVSDTGPKIPVEDMPRLFEPFDEGSRAFPEAATFGLYLVQKIVQRNRGFLRVETSERGASFYIEFTDPGE